MKRQHIIFNLDDTLVHCNKYFVQVINRFADQMTDWFPGIPREQVKQKQLEIDLRSVDKNGLTTEHFPQSFVDTYKYYCELAGREAEETKIDALRRLGESVFQIPVEPLPYMYETLERLKAEGHELYLHTGGDEANQRRKIAQLELAAYFDNRVFVSQYKDTAALEKILKQMKFDRDSTWMVGNSLRTDIVPAVELGIHAIHIPAKLEWEYNVVEVKSEPKGAFLTLNSLQEVPDAIHEYLKQSPDAIHEYLKQSMEKAE